jgi:4'-phosphopantetheinyl transferase
MDDSITLWPSPSGAFCLDTETAHVWGFLLRVSGAVLDHLAATLAPEEKRRAASFRFERDRNRYVAGRGTLRRILGGYLKTSPAAVRLGNGPYGKPFLVGEFADSAQFNLAHCEDIALLALTRGCMVGVDLERVRGMDDADSMAAGFCSKREYAEFKAMPESERDAGFFRLWTRKEAWLKATGEGIGECLNQVEVTFQSSQPARFLGLPSKEKETPNEWTLQELAPAPGFLGALALAGKVRQVCCWNWKEGGDWEIISIAK